MRNMNIKTLWLESSWITCETHREEGALIPSFGPPRPSGTETADQLDRSRAPQRQTPPRAVQERTTNKRRRPGLCYVATGAGVAADERPAERGLPSPNSVRQDRSRAPEAGAAPRHLPQIPAPPLCVTSATSRPGVGRGVRVRGPGSRDARPRRSRDYISQGASLEAVAAAAAGATTSPGSGARDFHSCVRRAEPETRPEAELGI